MDFRSARAFLAAALLLGAAGGLRAQTALESTLVPYLARFELPALAAAAVVRGKLVAAGAAGTRRIGLAVPATREDRFHLGTASQALTVLVAAQQVEAGRLLWSSTVGEVFQELAAGATPALRGVTLEQLLSHTSGLPAANEIFRNLLLRAQLEPGNLDLQRYALVRSWSRAPLAAVPGSQRIDSPMNYVVAAAMLERAARKSWEEQVVERVFDPLGLASAGLGPQSSPGRLDAPLPHRVELNGLEAMLAGPSADFPAIAAPAAGAHMSVLDYARWAGWVAERGRNGPKLVAPEAMEKILSLGWSEAKPDWAARALRRQSGSNGMNLAEAWLDPDSGFAMVLMTNVGGPKAAEGLAALARELYLAHAPR